MAVKKHEKTLAHNAREQDLYQKNNKILQQMFVLFPFSQENRCLIQHIRKMEGNDNEKMSVSINIKSPYFHQGLLLLSEGQILDHGLDKIFV